MPRLNRARLEERSRLPRNRRPSRSRLRIEALEQRLALAADFTGPYEMQNWTTSGITGGTTDINPDSGGASTADFSYNVTLGGGGVSQRSASFTAVADAAGQVTFNYEYTGFHAFFAARATFETLAGGVATPLVNDATVFDAFSFTGSSTINVTAGQTFGFRVGGRNGDSDSRLLGMLRITNFRAPSDADDDGILDEVDIDRIPVNSIADTDDGNLANGVTTLREAINAANSQPGHNTIRFNLPRQRQTIALTSGQLNVTDSVTIEGPGADWLTVSGNNQSRVFGFAGSGAKSYTIDGLDMADGSAAGDFGGAISLADDDDTLAIRRSVIRDSSASSGGGINVFLGNLQVSDSTFAHNSAGFGGAINIQDADVVLTNVTVSGNTAADRGGAALIFTNATSQTASLTIVNSTIANNSSPSGAAIRNDTVGVSTSTVTYRNTIFAGNTGSADLVRIDFSGGTSSFRSLGHNISDDASGNFGAIGDLVSTNPRLGPLADNGGPTPTHTLLAGSPAIDAVHYRNVVLADAPSRYYRLGESSNANPAVDAVAGVNGAYLNSPTVAQPGAIGGDTNTSVRFDGVNDYVDVPNNLTASFSLEAWVRTSDDSPTGTNAWQGDGIIWSDVGGIANDFVLGILNNRASYFEGGAIENSITGTTDLTDGKWHHLVVTRAAGGLVRLYVDGVQEGSMNAGSALLTANPRIHIGGNTLDGRFFGGDIDEVAFYNAVIPAGSVNLHYQSGLTPAADQRGVPRPQDGDRNGTTAADIGAVEHVAPFVVNSAADSDDGNTSNGTTTLREAVNAANNLPSADVISFDLPAGSTIPLRLGELLITDDLKIVGPGAGQLTIDASAGDPTPDANEGNGLRIFRSDDDAPLTHRTDAIVASSNNSPAGEGVANAIDNNPNTKYLNFDRLNTGFTVTPSVGATVVRGLSLTSANDAPERDPASYRIEGSNDGVNYSQIAAGSVPAFPNRFHTHTIDFSNARPFLHYRLIFPTVVGPAGNSMQIGEVELLGHRADEYSARIDLEISGLTLTGADARRNGGAIQNIDSLTIANSTISGNAADVDGGGVYNTGMLTVTNSTISGNSAGTEGGAILNNGPSLTIDRSTISGNGAGSEGGGVKIQNGNVTITNSTISGNTAANGGGGIQNAFGTLAISHSTITGNTDNATEYGRSAGGVWMFSGRLQLHDSIVAGNTSLAGLDIRGNGTVSSLGNNVIGRGAGGAKTQWTTGTGANDRYYEVVHVPAGITWTAADTAARAAGGHLATITSAEENAFVATLVDRNELWTYAFGRSFGPWLGGLQPAGSTEPGGGWTWRTGEGFSYTSWGTGEPSNGNGLEDRIHFYNDPTPALDPGALWNDAPSTATTLAYVIEYDGLTYHPSDLVGVNPLIGPLASNGGVTQTHALLSGSPAKDAIVEDAYSAVVLADAPLVYHRMDETSGTIAPNSSTAGAAGNGTYTGSIGLNVAAFSSDLGRAKNFDGTNAFVATPVSAPVALPVLTLEAWIRPSQAQAGRTGIMGFNDAAEFGFFDATTIQFWTPTTGALNVTYNSGANAGKWAHVVAVGTGSEKRIYINGELAGAQAHGTLPSNGYGNSNYSMRTGGGGIFDDPGVNGNFFRGDIDEVALYNSVLTAEQVRRHYRAAFATGNLAPLGVASQSTEYSQASFPASNALDGNFTNFTHTSETDPDPTWQVALPNDRAIGGVVLYNRTDCCPGRLRDVTIEVLDAANDVVWTSAVLNPGNVLNGPPTLSVDVPDGVIGRTVRVSRQPNGDPDGRILSLAEVQVIAAPATTDQRGASRPYFTGYDIGSFEVCATGDTNNDSRIDRTDAAILARNYGRTNVSCGEGDFDNNGRVDALDLALMQTRLVTPPPSPAASPAAAAVVTAARASGAGQPLRQAAIARANHLIGIQPAAPTSPRLTAARRTAVSAEATSAIDAALDSMVEAHGKSPSTRLKIGIRRRN